MVELNLVESQNGESLVFGLRLEDQSENILMGNFVGGCVPHFPSNSLQKLHGPMHA